ncbi:MAG TPA: hypothetical protein VIA98_12445 [Allosphingosinicella sp.]|jgi:hypothetical protein
MKIRILAALLVMGMSAPLFAAAADAPQSSAAEMTDRLRAIGQWMQRVTDAMAGSNEAALAFFRAVEEFSSGDAAKAREKIPALRAAADNWSEALAASETRLDRIEPLGEGAGQIPAAQFNRVLTDARALVAEMRRQAADTQRLADAFDRGDEKTVREIAPMLIRGGFLQLRQQVTIYRARQAIFSPSQSNHQMASVTIGMYQAMSVAAESWFAAAILKQNGAAAAQGAQFEELADQLEHEVQTGRRNLEREKATLASARASARNAPTRELADAVEPMAKLVGNAFTIGEDLVGWLRSRAQTSQASLAEQRQPQLLSELSAFEQRYVTLVAAAAATLGQAGR